MVSPSTDRFPSSEVAEVFATCPPPLRDKLLFLRGLVLRTAAELEGVEELEESLKWGAPSYLAKHGSTIRLGWTGAEQANPSQYAMYFTCSTTLVPTFRQLYPETLAFSGQRAILFDVADEVPLEAVTHCIELALTYHKKKHLPLLGA